jgi:hypothetical protein
MPDLICEYAENQALTAQQTFGLLPRLNKKAAIFST